MKYKKVKRIFSILLSGLIAINSVVPSFSEEAVFVNDSVEAVEEIENVTEENYTDLTPADNFAEETGDLADSSDIIDVEAQDTFESPEASDASEMPEIPEISENQEEELAEEVVVDDLSELSADDLIIDEEPVDNNDSMAEADPEEVDLFDTVSVDDLYAGEININDAIVVSFDKDTYIVGVDARAVATIDYRPYEIDDDLSSKSAEINLSINQSAGNPVFSFANGNTITIPDISKSFKDTVTLNIVATESNSEQSGELVASTQFTSNAMGTDKTYKGTKSCGATILSDSAFADNDSATLTTGAADNKIVISGMSEVDFSYTGDDIDNGTSYRITLTSSNEDVISIGNEYTNKEVKFEGDEAAPFTSSFPVFALKEGASIITAVFEYTSNGNPVMVKKTLNLQAVDAVFTVTFLDADGNTFHVIEDVHAGSKIFYDGQPESGDQIFVGWSGDDGFYLDNNYKVNHDVTFTPVYYGLYTVTWKDEDGTVLKTDEDVESGTVPAYNGNDPEKESDAHYTYEFTGWNPEPSAVTKDAEYTAVYAKIPNKYNITWIGLNDIELAVDEVEYGKTPSHKMEDKIVEDDKIYLFKGWNEEIVPVEGDATYTAKYEEIPRYYTVTWKNDDGSVLLEDNHVEYESQALYTGGTPRKTGTDSVSYVFSGWDKDITAPITEDTVFTAQYEEESAGYTVTWMANGAVIEKDTDVEYGTTPTYDGAEPTKPETAKATYTFKGWSPEIAPVTESVTYDAQFEEHVRTFTITWKNYDGTVLETDENVAYNTFPSYNGATPTKPSADGKDFTFNGWEEGLVNVTADATYTAKFRESATALKRFTVKWLNDDGTVLEEDRRVLEHSSPSYDSATPTKNPDAEYIYTFEGWSPALSEVTSNISYTATYSKVKQVYTVKWISDGSIIKTDEGVPYGTTPSYTGETPTKAPSGSYNFEFVGWSPIVKPVTGNMQYVAQFKPVQAKFEIKWLNWDGAVLETDEDVPAGTTPEYNGETPVRKTSKEVTYKFVGWDKTVEPVSKDAEYRAVFESNTNTYIVRWYDDDMKLLETDQDVPYGTTPSFDGATPTKESNAHYDYTFAGWDHEIHPVEENLEYVARYDRAVRKYTVTWKDEDGTVLETDKDVEFGTTATYDGNLPTKEATAQYTYEFLRWEPELFVVRGDMEYTATYKAILNDYTVTFNENGHGLLNVKNQVVGYGYKAQTPIEPEEAKGFKFVGWYTDADCTEKYDFDTPVTKDITLYAKWDVVYYSISIFNEGKGTAVADAQTASAGTKVTLTATPDAGYRFDKWTVKSGDFTISDDSFTMPLSDVNIQAKFVPITYTITVVNGKANTKETVPGKEIQLTADAAISGREFAGWVVNKGDVTLANAASERTTFTLGEKDVVVSATYKDAPAKPAPKEYFTTNRTTAVEAGAKEGEVKYGLLKLRTSKIAKKSITLTWNKIGKNLTFEVYGGKSNGSLKKLATLSDKNTYKHSGLKKGTYYKYRVLAFDSDGKQVGKSIDIYVATKGGSSGNYTRVSLDKKKLTIKLNKSKKVKATVKSGSSSVKKFQGVKFESSNKSVATVNSKGKIKAVGKGTCVIYAYAQNGVSASVVVTVK